MSEPAPPGTPLQDTDPEPAATPTGSDNPAAVTIPRPESPAARVVDGPPVTESRHTEAADADATRTEVSDAELSDIGMSDPGVINPGVINTDDPAAQVDSAGAESIPAGPVPAQSIPAQSISAQSIPAESIPAESIPAESIPSPWLEPDAAGPHAALAFNLHRHPGEGEDSDPILRQGTDLALIGVFDGMGGAGGTVYRTPDGPRTGAFLASRTARDAAERHLVQAVRSTAELDGHALADDLRAALAQALADRYQELQAPASGLRSRLLRALPTTMAVALLQRPEPGSPAWQCHLFSAGDSRVYVLQPDAGVQQLTVDDIRDRGDAMTNLRQDSVVSNALSADTPFDIRYRRIDLEEPFVLLASTDGCFGYLPTPMHFERTVLAALCAGGEPVEWSRHLQQAINAVAGDDAAMALLTVGAAAADVPSLFGARLRWLDEHVLAPLAAQDTAVRDAEQRLATVRAERDRTTAALWTNYKASYARRLSDGAGPTAGATPPAARASAPPPASAPNPPATGMGTS